MSILLLSGSLGIGLVWGWLAALIPFKLPRLNRQNLKALIALATGTISLAGTVIAFMGWRLAIVFLAGAILTFLINLNWRKSLTQRDYS